ncbi:MAG: tyrosine-protein phosphatase [bacterium]|nr:tyrosine-protein phosphatase [bacterium]
MRVAAFLLLFGLLAPPGASPGPSADPGNPSSRDVMVGDNSVFPPGNVRVAERLFDLPGLTDVGRVAPGIFRGAQPELEGYATLKALGVRTVVNLRTRRGEREAVEAAGMRYVEIPMSFMKKVDPAVVREALSVISDPANQLVFLHCSRGKDRTGVVVAVYRMEVDGWSKAEALAEMEAFGFHEIWFRLKKTVEEWRTGG